MKICVFGRARYEQLKSRTEQIASHGVDVHVLSLQSGQMNHATVHQIPASSLIGGFGFPVLSITSRRLLKRLRPDVIDIHGVSSYGGYCFAPLPHVPVCATVYGSDITAHAAVSRVGRSIAKACLTRADLVYASSPVAGEDITRVLSLDLGERFVTRSWGIKMDDISKLNGRDRDKERAELNISDTAAVIVHNRQYCDFWRVDSMLNVATNFCQLPDRYFLFVCPPGDAVAQQKIKLAEQTVREMGLGDRVRFLHSIDHDRMLRIFNAADIFTCFGDADLLSSSVLEAMSLGLIPVLRNLPAYREIIQDSFNGYLHDELVESEVLDRFAQIAASLPHHRENFADPNRKLIATEYDARECSRWMVDRYRQLKERSPGSSIFSSD